MASLRAALDWRSRSVLRRNALVYLRNWRTAFVPPAFEPVAFFVAFGLGLAGYVGHLAYYGQLIDYPTYVSAGLLAYSAFGTAYYEGLYSSYVRMFYQKTWDGILATQVELPHIVWGEVFWAGCRGMMNTTVVALVLVGFDLAQLIDIHWEQLPFVLPLALIAGWAFAAFALIFTAIVPSIDHMNYPVFMIGMPLSLVSNTYFPVVTEHAWLRWLVRANPVYHLAETFRSTLVLGAPRPEHLVGLACTVGLTLVGCILVAQRLLRRRVLGE